MKNIFIIAECGVNHNGNLDTAFDLVDNAVESGADAIKFQTFKAENIITKSAAKADYQQESTDLKESQFSMLKRLELTHQMHCKLLDYCKYKRILFISTAFDLESLDFLVNILEVKTLKIASGEITNGPLLLSHSRSGCDLILSTGMSTLGEIEEALGVIAFGLIYDSNTSSLPSREDFQEAYFSPQGQQLLKEKVTLLHCTTEYPAQYEEINMKSLHTLSNAFGLKVGYSDHSEGIIVPIVAATLGAVVIEKHFTLDKTLPGPDHKASLEPDELKEMVTAIRSVECIMGNGLKVPSVSELKNRTIARKSLVAATRIEKGDLFSEQNLAIKRSGNGVSPMEYWNVLGTKSDKNYRLDDLVYL